MHYRWEVQYQLFNTNRTVLHSIILLKNLIFQVPQSRSSPSRSPWWNPSQRDAPPLESSFTHLSNSPVYEPPQPPPPRTRFPWDGKGSPCRETPVSGDFPTTSSRVPSDGATPPPQPSHPPRPLRRASSEREAPSTEPPSPALIVPGRRAFLQVPQDVSLTKLRLFFHKVSFTLNTLCWPLCEMLYACHVNFLAEVLELFMYTVFQLVICEKALLECFFRRLES